MIWNLRPLGTAGTKHRSLIYQYRKYLDCKTVVFFHFRKARSAVSVILACEAREPHTPVRVRRERLSPFSLSVSTLAPDLSFEYYFTVSLAFAKNTTVLQSRKYPKHSSKLAFGLIRPEQKFLGLILALVNG